MKAENINREFLDGVLRGEYPDVYYHFGVDSSDPVLEKFRDLKAVVLAGSGERIKEFARTWSGIRGGSPVIALPKEERFVTRYCDRVLFASHGMGMPSASICVQELMRMAYYLKGGDLEELDRIFWARVGTSGGLGVEPGTVILTTESLQADGRPYRLLAGEREHYFDGTFPGKTAAAIAEANRSGDIEIVTGKTVAANEFFIEQMRRDGAICLSGEAEKFAWLDWIYKKGVRNIEMEGAMLSGFLNHWGFSEFAMICCTIVDRTRGDQVTSTPEQLGGYNRNAGKVLFNYLEKFV